MSAYRGNVYQLYDRFRHDLVQAAQPDELLATIQAKLLPALNARTVALLNLDIACKISRLSIISSIGYEAFWGDYLALCRANIEPLSRVIRLSPHPVSLSDLRHHQRLAKRSHGLVQLLSTNDLNDAFAAPATDQQLRCAMMVIAGNNMTLRPAHRHLLGRVATDTLSRLQELGGTGTTPEQTGSSAPVGIAIATIVSATPPAEPDPSCNAAVPPPHLTLTARQLEVAAWLVAGKSDWEIGEILCISHKTVNFHVENIKRIYGVKSRNQVVAAIVHDGGLEPVPGRSPQPNAMVELSGT